MGLSTEPFKKVRYFVPFSEPTSAKRSTYLGADDMKAYIQSGKLKQFKYVYEDDKESIEMMFANIDDPQQTMESIISKIIDADDADFKNLATWQDCMEKVAEKSQKGSGGKGEDVSVLSWRKFKRVFRKAIQVKSVKKGSTVIMDRASFHRKTKLTNLARRHGVKLLFLPAYSPDFNPIEKTWANMKKALIDILPDTDDLRKAVYGYFGVSF